LDECISKEGESSDSNVSDDDTHIDTNTQSATIEKSSILWSTHKNTAPGRLPATSIMKKKPSSVTPVQTIIQTFKLFITNEILNEIILQTNKYASRYVDQQNQKRLNVGTNPTKSNKWENLDCIELEAFLGLLTQASVGHVNHESLTELWDISQSRPIYHATMSLQRFKQLLRFLRFDDRQRRDKLNRLALIQYVLQGFIKQLPRNFVPGEKITVDEQLIRFRGRCLFVQ
jgi:hypothetical protein